MPYKSEKAKIAGTKHDRRRKLTNEQKAEIKTLYETGEYSQRELARQYGVSRRLVVFCIYPERQVKNYEKRVEKGGSKIYYVKDKHTASVRKHRHHKQDLFLKGEIDIPPSKIKTKMKIFNKEATLIVRVQFGMKAPSFSCSFTDATVNEVFKVVKSTLNTMTVKSQIEHSAISKPRISKSGMIVIRTELGKTPGRKSKSLSLYNVSNTEAYDYFMENYEKFIDQEEE